MRFHLLVETGVLPDRLELVVSTFLLRHRVDNAQTKAPHLFHNESFGRGKYYTVRFPIFELSLRANETIPPNCMRGLFLRRLHWQICMLQPESLFAKEGT